MGVTVREKKPGSGVWWVFINHNGIRKSKKVGSEKAAEKVKEQIEAHLTLGTLDISEPEKPPIFKEVAETWLEGHVKPLRRQSTYERYNDVLKKHVFPAIGKTPIDEVKRPDIKNLILKMNKAGYSKSMLSLVRDVISGVIWQAIDDEYIEKNPVTGIFKRLEIRTDKQLKVEPMTSQEVEKFLTACKKNEPDYYPLFLCAFRTGLRLGELLALEWSDVSFNDKRIRVSKSFRREQVEHTKTDRIRHVDMSNQLIRELKKLNKARKEEALKAGTGKPVDIVFHRNGGYMAQNSVRNVWKRVLKDAGLKHTKLHTTRHSYASQLLSNGESTVYVKEQLGHSKITTTVDIYGQWIPSGDREAVNRLDKAGKNHNCK